MEGAMDNLDICRLSVIEQEEAIRAKRLSPVALMNAVLQRIEQQNPAVNAFCTMAWEAARKQAREAEVAVMKGDRLGPLHGIPVSIKDLIFTRGLRTTGGSKIYEDFVPTENDVVVDRLESAGAIIIGKTNTSEFGWVATTDNRTFGPTRNPWNHELNAGGSSGGAAASVALCMGSLAIGSDGGGSIRIPSSFCGVFGIKPSFGRVPRGPGFGNGDTLAHIGPITRKVGDAALALDIMSGRDDRDWFSLPGAGISYLDSLVDGVKGLKMAWSANLGYARVDPRVIKITAAAAGKFEQLGASVDEVSPDLGSPERAFSTYMGLQLANALKDKLEDWRSQIDPLLVVFMERQLGRPATDYLGAWQELLAYSRKMFAFFDKYDLLLTPAVAVLPFRNSSYGPREIAGNMVSPLAWMDLTYPFNVTGQPAASIPCGWTDEGLPVGLQIVGGRFDDANVLRASAAFEMMSPWRDTLPPGSPPI
jgi:aspartyl-tRNA(Asn)/glutamyl-tRNA(Gln) amidotransferase subunit A